MFRLYWQCKGCSSRFLNYESFSTHAQSCTVQEAIEDSWTCKDCNSRFFNFESFHAHVQQSCTVREATRVTTDECLLLHRREVEPMLEHLQLRISKLREALEQVKIYDFPRSPEFGPLEDCSDFCSKALAADDEAAK